MTSPSLAPRCTNRLSTTRETTAPAAAGTTPAHPANPRLTLLATLAAALALAACGGGDDATNAGGGTPAPAPAPAPAPVPTPPPPPAAAVPVITADLPTTLNVREAETGTLTVVASSPDASALGVRWLRNDAEIASAGTAATATVPTYPFAVSYPAETWQAEVRNAAGATRSAITQVQRVPRQWLDVGTAHAAQGVAQVRGEGQRARHADNDGRVHEASVHEGENGTVLAFRGEPLAAAGEAWAYSSTLPASDPSAEVTHLSLAATFTGEIVATWLETVQGTVDRHLVRAALYRPGATATAAGSWALIGTVSDPLLEASEPTVVQVGADSFGIAWLQRSGAGQPRSAVQRRYTLPAAGSEPGSGLGSVFEMEGMAADISRLRLLGVGGQLALMFVEASGSTPARWQYATSPSGIAWTAPADLGADDGFADIHWAPPVNGQTVLATADGNGRLFTRRVDVATATWLDGGWSYTANAYGSAPALLIDASGRIDVFGVSVNTAAGHTSVLGHWVYTPSAGWGAGTVLASSATDFREGLGLRAPQAGRDNAGNLVLTWLERGASTAGQRLRVQRYSSFSAAWTAPSDLAAPAAATTQQSAPMLTVHESGRASASWADAPGDGNDQLRHARLR